MYRVVSQLGDFTSALGMLVRVLCNPIMRMSYNGNTSAFQADDVGSIPSIRSMSA